MNDIKVLIIEDEALIATDIADILEEYEYRVSGIAHKAEEAFFQLENNRPDIVLLDINLNDKKDGLDIGAHILKNYELPIIYLTAYADKATVERAKHTRPMGYIVKPFDGKDIYSSIELALYNYANIIKPVCFDRTFINRKIYSPITEKEFEIAKDIYEGKTNRQLAEKHFISINTVKTHVKNLYEKLDARSRSEAIVRLRKIMGK
ncbi:MAG TPA: response regulator transcription factor [Bacteroidetes bacterium]|nr:response regulator transcription factor [Bacteroidota bacterium]